MVFLHGLASNHTRWSELLANTTLGTTHHLYAPDLYGHGATANLGACGDLTRWLEDLSAFLTANHDAPAVIVGHSLGAQVAMFFAARYPQQVESLFLIDPVLRSALHHDKRWLLYALPMFKVAVRVVRGLNSLGLTRRNLIPQDLQVLDETARVALRSPENTRAFIRQYSSTRADLKHIHTAQYLQDLVEFLKPPPPWADISCPVRVLLSSGDVFASAVAVRREMAALSCVSFAAIDCHHWPLTERPTEVREMIEQWVRSGEVNR